MSNQNKLWITLFAFGKEFVLFFVINVAFLIGVKGLSYAEFFSLNAIAGFVSLLCFFPIMFLMTKLSNKTMIIISQALRVISMSIFIFGDHYVLFVLANCLYFLAFQFSSVFTSLLKGNLKDIGKEQEFIKVFSRGQIVSAIVDVVAVSIAGVLFITSPFLAMMVSLGFCVFSFVLSFFVKNPKEVEKVDLKKSLFEVKEEKRKIKKNKVIWEFVLLVVAFVVCFYGAFNLSLSYVKTSLQELQTSIWIVCVVVGLERISRLVGFWLFPKLKAKDHYSSNFLAIIGLILSVTLILLPMFIFENFVLKIVITSLGAMILGSSISLYRLSFQNFMNKFVSLKKQRRAAFVVATSALVGIVFANSLLVFVCRNLELKIASLVIFGIIIIALILFLFITQIIKKKNIKPIYKYVSTMEKESIAESQNQALKQHN